MNVTVEERRMGMWPCVREWRKKEKTSYPAPGFGFVTKSTSFECPPSIATWVFDVENAYQILVRQYMSPCVRKIRKKEGTSYPAPAFDLVTQ